MAIIVGWDSLMLLCGTDTQVFSVSLSLIGLAPSLYTILQALPRHMIEDTNL